MAASAPGDLDLQSEEYAAAERWTQGPLVRRRQKWKPEGERHLPWNARTPDTLKYINNFRKSLRHQLKRAIKAYHEEYTAVSAPSAQGSFDNLLKQYRKLCYLEDNSETSAGADRQNGSDV